MEQLGPSFNIHNDDICPVPLGCFHFGNFWTYFFTSMLVNVFANWSDSHFLDDFPIYCRVCRVRKR